MHQLFSAESTSSQSNLILSRPTPLQGVAYTCYPGDGHSCLFDWCINADVSCFRAILQRLLAELALTIKTSLPAIAREQPERDVWNLDYTSDRNNQSFCRQKVKSPTPPPVEYKFLQTVRRVSQFPLNWVYLAVKTVCLYTLSVFGRFYLSGLVKDV